jgi:hypothetical protein
MSSGQITSDVLLSGTDSSNYDFSSMDQDGIFGSLGATASALGDKLTSAAKNKISGLANKYVNSLTSSIDNKLAGMGQSVKKGTAPTHAEKIDSTTPWRLRLVSVAESETLEFMVTPNNLDESGSAEYSASNTVHTPGNVMVYKSSSSRGFNVGVRMIARHEAEADLILKYMNVIRSWVKPYFGTGTASQIKNKKLFGAPPSIIKLYAYGQHHLYGVPCVLESYNFSWPNDCDYIPSSSAYNYEPVPVVMDFSMTFKETFSGSQLEKFNIYDYKNGICSNLSPGASSKKPKQSTKDKIASKALASASKVLNGQNLGDLLGQINNCTITEGMTNTVEQAATTASLPSEAGMTYDDAFISSGAGQWTPDTIAAEDAAPPPAIIPTSGGYTTGSYADVHTQIAKEDPSFSGSIASEDPSFGKPINMSQEW